MKLCRQRPSFKTVKLLFNLLIYSVDLRGDIPKIIAESGALPFFFITKSWLYFFLYLFLVLVLKQQIWTSKIMSIKTSYYYT